MSPKSIEVKILPRRFEFIKKMYISDKMIAANKKDLIFNWFFEQFGNFQNETSSYTYELLWKTFYEILCLEKNQCSSHRILIKSNAISNLVNTVTNFPFTTSWSSVILSSITVLLQTPTVNAALIADVEKLFLLLFGSLKVICKIEEDKNNNDAASRKEAINLATIVLDILENLPASNDDQKALLLADHLQHLTIFVHIASYDVEMHDISEKLARKITSIIFNVKEKTFETLLTPTDNAVAVERPNPNILQFFYALQRFLMCEGTMHYSVPLSAGSGILIGKLLTIFLNQNKSSLYSLKVVSLLFAIAGLDIPIVTGSNSCCKSLFRENVSNIDHTISALSYLLESCSTVSQYFISTGVPEGYIKPSVWLKGVSAALLDVKVSKSKAALLKCFRFLIIISPTIIENDILQLIKVAILNISVHSKETKKNYCELFSVILETHSKLHQVPKFFVKLLLALTECIKEDSGGNLLKNGQILPQVLDAIAKCVQELPYGQMVEVWKMFIETFTTLENMSQAFNVSQSFIFFIAQLVSAFLIHAPLAQANIPSNINSQFSSLIESTCDEIKKNISALKDTDNKVVPLQSSILLLCYAVGEIKLMHIKSLGELPISTEGLFSNDIFDFSVIHSYLDQNYAPFLERFMKHDEKILSYLVFQLMVQKIISLSIYSESADQSSESHAIHLQGMVCALLQYLHDSSNASESWDLDISTINMKNYGSAFWKSFLKISEFIIHYLQPEDAYYFCTSAQDIILQDNGCENGAKSFILSSLKNVEFEECRNYQTAFVSSIWKQSNLLHTKKRLHGDMEVEERSIDRIFTLLNSFGKKSLKYAQRTPKSDKNLGTMWNEIKEIADLLNSILLSESLPKDKIIIKNVKEIIKLIKMLPLRFLLPGNQMKTIMGLSLIFFLIPQSCSADEAVILTKEISHLLIFIFEGARSIWLFDFITSGTYLKFVVKTIESVLSDKFDDNQEWVTELIEYLVSFAIKNVESLNGLENFISEIASKDKCSKSDLIILHALMEKLSRILSHPHTSEKYQETLIKISLFTLQSFVKQMKMNFNDISETTYHYNFVNCYMPAIELICTCTDVEKFKKVSCELLPTILEKALNFASNSDVKQQEAKQIRNHLRFDNIMKCNEKSQQVNILKNLYMLLISKICKHFSKLSAFLPEDFTDWSWKVIFSHFRERQKIKTEFFKTHQDLKNFRSNSSEDKKSSCCILCSAYSDCISDMKSNRNLSSADFINDKSFLPYTLNESEEKCLKELSVITPSEVLHEIFLHLLKEMDCFNSASNDIFSLQLSILICRCLIDANSEKCMQTVLNDFMQKLLSQLHYITNQACDSFICHTMVIIPILNFIDFIVKGNKGLSREILLQNLHCVAIVPLEVYDGDYSIFVSSFNAIWKVVYNLFMHHTSVILASPAPFLNYVSKLLKSIVSAGSSTSLSKCDPKTFQHLQLCGQSMDRLLTVISRHKNEFSKLVPYLIADYVDAVQHITLDSGLKESLLSGIYRLLDICSEEAIKMLAVDINYICREIYTNLVRNYRQTKQMAS